MSVIVANCDGDFIFILNEMKESLEDFKQGWGTDWFKVKKITLAIILKTTLRLPWRSGGQDLMRSQLWPRVSIPGRGTKIPQAEQCSQKKEKKNRERTAWMGHVEKQRCRQSGSLQSGDSSLYCSCSAAVSGTCFLLLPKIPSYKGMRGQRSGEMRQES